MTSSNTVLGEIQVRPLAPSGEGGSLVCGNPAPGQFAFSLFPSIQSLSLARPSGSFVSHAVSFGDSVLDSGGLH